MASGTVKWFNDSKGYGLVEGARVEYEAREGEKGPEAINVAAAV